MKAEASELFKAEKFPEAIVKFEECVKIDPLNANFNATLLLNISIAQEKLGNNTEKL
jgi:hypothetical protein